MPDQTLLTALTDLAAKQADLIVALINFYGLVVVGVIGWIVNTGKDGPGVSWARIILFNLGFLCFFVATFAGFLYLYDRFSLTTALWADVAAGVDRERAPQVRDLIWLPPRQWLWAIWVFNVLIILLAAMLLRQGGYGRSREISR